MNTDEKVNRERLVETFVELIRINSPSFHEKEIGRLLSARLDRLGCKVELRKYNESFNLHALKKGNVPDAMPLLLSGHMDTVEPTEGLTFSLKDGIIRSTGNTVLGADDKSAIAPILEALHAIEEHGLPHGDIEIVLTSAEEKGLHGAKNLEFSTVRSRHALVLDSSGSVGKIVVGAPTHHTYEMVVTGRPAHAGIEPEKGISAIRTAAAIISALPDGRIDEVTTANIGMIKGGTATNIVPKEVVVHGEMRSHNHETLRRLRNSAFSKAHEIAESNGAQIMIHDQEEYKAFRITEDEPFLRFIDDVYRGCAVEPVHVLTGGGSDANIFFQHGIIPLNISTGMQKVHSTDEFIAVQDLFDCARIVLRAVTSFAGFRA